MAGPGEDVYATLLLNDSYLPGVLVLAHSLRDAGTRKKLAVLLTTDSVSVNAMTELQKVYDFLIPVDRIVNPAPSNLTLMDRHDLHSAFTKIALWRQLQFRRVVYVDADMVALRAPDELFLLDAPFSAAPDIGWPDLFNSGLMVFTPNLGDYYGLKAMAERGISFDGADQGLLNMYFGERYNRISFSYNVTPSAHYQYMPAFRHFSSSISMAHFIGKEKPWLQGRDASTGTGPYNELVGRWWATYDRHYKTSAPAGTYAPMPTVVQQHVQGEWQPPKFTFYQMPSPDSFPNTVQATIHDFPRQTIQEHRDDHGYHEHPAHEHPHQTDHEHADCRETHPPPADSQKEHATSQEYLPQSHIEAPPPLPPPVEDPYVPPPQSSWDAARAPPPPDSRPEAQDFPSTHYSMSTDTAPFVPPEAYPEPPKNMWYEVPKEPPTRQLAPIFPWEKNMPAPTRVFRDEQAETLPPSAAPAEEPADASVAPVTPVTPTFSFTPTESWQTYSRGNAWDNMPEIERYVDRLSSTRRGTSRKKPFMKLGDFPTDTERPSLAVTPAPVRGGVFWGHDRDMEMPPAEGVPSQADWDPSTQLELLARQQAAVLEARLGKGILELLMERRPPLSGGASPHGLEVYLSLDDDVPDFELLASSAIATHTVLTASSLLETGTVTGESPGLEDAALSSLADTVTETAITDPDETPVEERDVDVAAAAATSPPASSASIDTAAATATLAPAPAPAAPLTIEEPSYKGPGAAWSKYDDALPAAATERQLEPSEEEKDVLET